jgi:hypothetical protein
LKAPRPFWNPKCRGKICHGSRAEALFVRDRMVTTGRVVSGELEVYKCPSCARFHLGHPIGWSRTKYEACASRSEGRT